jgi:phenylacetate-CoA ligase
MGFLHEHIILPLSDLLKGESVHKYLRLLREAESWSDEKMKEFQQQRLHQLLVYASQEVPFYRDWIQTHDLNPDFLTLDQMPIVSKAIMRNEGIDRFSAEHFPVKKRIPSRSGGSTGEPFTFYETKLSYSVNMAAKLRTWYQAGYHLGDLYMKITNGKRTSKVKQLQDLMNNCIYVPFYSITDDILKSILDKIESTKPHFIRSYPSPLYLLVRYRNNHSNYHFSPRHIMTTGSTLTEDYRNEIEKAFGCDIIDSYSCEGTPNVYETPSHDGYNISGYYGIIEVLDNDNKPVVNGVGRVVSTNLWNFAHPFVRYDTQDLVEVKGGRIIRIMGRQCETLVEANGPLLTVHNFTHYFSDDFPSVDGWQVVKLKDGNIRFRLVVNKLFSPDDEQNIINHWSSCTGREISLEIVDKLPLMSNNKHLSIIDEP